MRKLKVFILDDQIDHSRSALKDLFKDHDVTLARDINEAKIEYHGVYDVLLLDHDLDVVFQKSDEPNTGYQFAKWLIDHERGVESDPLIFCHSWNPDGRKAMFHLLDDEGYRVKQMPFNDDYFKLLRTMFVNVSVNQPNHEVPK